MTTEAFEVQEYVDEEIEETADQAFSVNSLELAEWALKRIAALKALMAENERVADANIAREKLRLERLNRWPARGVEFFTSHLRLFAELSRELLLKGGKRKSRALPSGSIGWRTKPAGLEVKDSEALLRWAASVSSELVRVKREPALVEIKKYVARTGEIPPGTEPIPECEVFEVKTLEASNGSDS